MVCKCKLILSFITQLGYFIKLSEIDLSYMFNLIFINDKENSLRDAGALPDLTHDSLSRLIRLFN